jgi:predicted TPR repeat methyltransferase
MENKTESTTPTSSVGYFDKLADSFDAIAENAGYTLPQLVFDLAPSRDRQEPYSVLDIGIGTGLCSERFAAAGYKVIGIDGSQAMLELCKQKKIAHSLIEATIEDCLPPLNEQFPVALCCGIFEFIRNSKAFIKSVFEVLSTDGVFILAIRDAELNPQFPSLHREGYKICKKSWESTQMVVYQHEWSIIQQEMLDVGFKVNSAHEVVAYNSPALAVPINNRVVSATRL